MKSIILCEGSTDGVLLQYFMREVHQWEDVNKQKKLFGEHAVWFRSLKKANDRLDIVSCRGSSKLLPCLEYLFDLSKIANSSEAYEKVVILTDRDEYRTEGDFVDAVSEIMAQNEVKMIEQLVHNEWTSCEYKTINNRTRNLQLLLLVIPFENNGAMETFLLNAISAKDPYDAIIIQQGNQFVENVDPERRYLTQRRYITKAKFDVYFSIRTSAAQFSQRQDILRGVKWEDYIDVQGDFEKLADLSEQ